MDNIRLKIMYDAVGKQVFYWYSIEIKSSKRNTWFNLSTSYTILEVNRKLNRLAEDINTVDLIILKDILK